MIPGDSSVCITDINLASALLTVGIGPRLGEPVRLTASDNGRDYVQFLIDPCSPCGGYRSADLMQAWGSPAAFHSERPDHPFSLLMKFIAARPRGCSCKDDWLMHIASFLEVRMDLVRKTYQGIGLACQASPDTDLSYLCAFLRNRIDLIAAAKLAEKTGSTHNMINHGPSIATISERLPKRARDFLNSQFK